MEIRKFPWEFLFIDTGNKFKSARSLLGSPWGEACTGCLLEALAAFGVNVYKCMHSNHSHWRTEGGYHGLRRFTALQLPPPGGRWQPLVLK